MAKRAPTAYFIFSEEKRAEARAECLQDATTEKVSVAVVAKKIGEKWRALPEEERKRYKELAAQKSVEASAIHLIEEASEDCRELVEGNQESRPGEKRKHNQDSNPPSFLPHALVRRIMCMDPDVQRVSGDTIVLMARVACLFLDLLAEKTFSAACQNKRRTIKFQDVERAVRSDQRLVEIGLKDVLSTEDLFAAARSEAVGGKENEPGLKTGNSKCVGKGTQPITAFFSMSEPVP
eukprot:jgi/Botrbrau1/8846/Bobra.50_2s0006.1